MIRVQTALHSRGTFFNRSGCVQH